MKKETYAAPVMEIVLLERMNTVLISGCEPIDCSGVCLGDCSSFTPVSCSLVDTEPCLTDGVCIREIINP